MRVLKFVLVIFIVIGVLIAGATLIVPVIMLANEPYFAAQELDNPYISSEFLGWETVQIDNWDTFMVPANWKVSSNGDIFQIKNTDNCVLARGAILGTTDSVYADENEFFSAMVEKMVHVEHEFVPGFASIHLSDFTRVYISDDSHKSMYYCMSLAGDNSTALCWMFPCDFIKSEDELKEIVQAVVYSYEFKI